MGLFDKVEKGLERSVNRAFAKAFRSEVQPVEIASAIRRAMDDKAAAMGPGRTMVPNRYTIVLSPTDFARLDEYSAAVTQDLIAAAQEHAETQRYTPGGPIQIQLTTGDELETGVFQVRTAASKVGDVAGAPSPYAAPLAPPAGPDPYARPAPAPAPDAPAPAPGPVAPAPTAAPPGAPGAVNPAKRPWLDIDGERYPLLGSLTVIGRDGSADVVVDDPGISRRHSEIRITNDGPHLVCSIRDLASTNGTFVNGERVLASSRLEDGDRLTVGRTSLVFRAGKR
jgi:hypothetical protein